MPINAHPEYIEAEKEYHKATTTEERIKALEKMISSAPRHKGGENLRKNLKTRYKKLKEKTKKKSGSKKEGIKKKEMQAVLIGLTNSGKSSILQLLTNKHPKIGSYGFTTQKPEIGTLIHKGCEIQIIDMPPIASEGFDKGIINTTDTILIIIEKIHEIKEILKNINNKKAKKIIIFNKIDQYNKDTKRKIKETLKSKRYNHVLISSITEEGIDKLKEKILNSFEIIRIYTRKPEKKKHDNKPAILPPNSTLKDVAKKLRIKKPKYAKITGPSGKFPEQRVGLKHKVKDKDVVEFITE